MIARLLDTLEVHLGQTLRQDAARLGLSEATARVLLACEPGDLVPMTQLATRLGRENSTATRLVDRAEREGLVIRVAGADDRRSRIVRLSPAGEDRRRALLEQRELRAKALEAAVGAEIGLTPDQMEWFLTALARAIAR